MLVLSPQVQRSSGYCCASPESDRICFSDGRKLEGRSVYGTNSAREPRDFVDVDGSGNGGCGAKVSHQACSRGELRRLLERARQRLARTVVDGCECKSDGFVSCSHLVFIKATTKRRGTTNSRRATKAKAGARRERTRRSSFLWLPVGLWRLGFCLVRITCICPQGWKDFKKWRKGSGN